MCIHSSEARFTNESFYESILVKDSVELIREPFEMCLFRNKNNVGTILLTILGIKNMFKKNIIIYYIVSNDLICVVSQNFVNKNI